MRGTNPLLGVFVGLAVPPTSRVPHLTAHILSRKSRSLSKTHQCNQLQLRHGRSFHSVSSSQLELSHSRRAPPVLLANEFDGPAGTSASTIDENNLQSETRQTTEDTKVGEDEAQETMDAQKGVEQLTESLRRMQFLMEGRHPEIVRFGLRDTPLTKEFIRTADSATFTEVVQVLDAEEMFGDYKLVYRNVKPSLITQPRYRSIRILEGRLADFAHDMDRIFQMRRDAGHLLKLNACKVFLRAAAFMGDAQRALHMFDTIMPEDGTQPDVECFNLLMEALCWNHAFTKSEWHDLRVTETRLRIRRVGNAGRPLRFSGHKVDTRSTKWIDPKAGLRHQVLTRFRTLIAANLRGNEATFTNVMVAMGRERDLTGVKSILKSVWNIDADMLNEYDEEEIESPTFYEEGTPLRPSVRLLFTIVHVFGTNNQVGVAFALLDYVSRNYNLPITQEVWFELCIWTRVACAYRTQAQKRKGEAVGQVDWRVFEKLWQVMTDEPHNIVPTVPFWYHRVANLERARMLDDEADSTRQMLAGLAITKARATELFREMMYLIEHLKGHDVEQPLTAEFLDKRRDFIIASQEYDRDLQMTVVAVRRIFNERFWAGGRMEHEWATRRLPVLLAEFVEYAPDAIEYHTPTGIVQLDFKRHREQVWQSSKMMPGTHFHDTTWLGILRRILDEDDHEVVRWRIQSMQPCGSVRRALENDSDDDLAEAVLAVLGPLEEQQSRASRPEELLFISHKLRSESI